MAVKSRTKVAAPSNEARLSRRFVAAWKLEHDALEIELGHSLQQVQRDLSRSAPLTHSNPIPKRPDRAVLQGPVDDARKLARLFLGKFKKNLYSAICDPNDPDNQEITAHLKAGADKLGIFIAGMLVMSYGMLPGIAALVAAIFAKRFTNAAHESVCEIWAQELGIPSKKNSGKP